MFCTGISNSEHVLRPVLEVLCGEKVNIALKMLFPLFGLNWTSVATNRRKNEGIKESLNWIFQRWILIWKLIPWKAGIFALDNEVKVWKTVSKLNGKFAEILEFYLIYYNLEFSSFDKIWWLILTAYSSLSLSPFFLR